MKNTTLLLITIIIVLVIGGFVFVNGRNSLVVKDVPRSGETIPGNMQRVVLSQNGYNYKDANVQAGKPIALSADNSVGGCLRSVVFNIEGKRYSKYLRTSEDIIELPALSKGTYPFSCTMGMGYGKLIVK